MREIEVNGIKYRAIENSKPKRSKTVTKLLLTGIMLGGLGKTMSERAKPDVNIVEEYRLIQQKKSNLSKSQRNWVESEFERNFEKIPK